MLTARGSRGVYLCTLSPWETTLHRQHVHFITDKSHPLDGNTAEILCLFRVAFRTVVPFWGQTIQISSSLYPKRDCGSKRPSSGAAAFPVRASDIPGTW